MRFIVVLFAVVLLGAFQPRAECRATDGQGAGRTTRIGTPLPFLVRLGQAYFLRLDNAKQNPSFSSSSPSGADPDTPGNRALQLQLSQRLLQGKVADLGRMLGGYGAPEEETESAERTRRSDDPPISLDLTFHLLREVLEMARAEQVAQQANSNRKMMDIFGK